MAYLPPPGTKIMKKCAHCKQEKPLSGFYKCSRRKDGLQANCRVCHKDKARIYYAQHQSTVLENVKARKKEEAEAAERHAYRTGALLGETSRLLIIRKAITYKKIWMPPACQICGHEPPKKDQDKGKGLKVWHFGDWKDLRQDKVVWCCDLCRPGVERSAIRSMIKRGRAEKP